MNHQPYETWILLDERLTPEQNRELRDHLQNCPQCQRLAQAHRQISQLFQTTPAPYPKAGFTTRWKKRLKRAEQSQNRTITWISLSVLSLALLGTMVGLSIQLTPLTEQFPQLLLIGISQAALWSKMLTALQNLFLPLLRVSIKMIPSTWVIALTITCSGVALAWLISLSKSSPLMKEV
jgi:anti-sigma factor RsiW